MMKLVLLLLSIVLIGCCQKVDDGDAPADFDETQAPDTNVPVVFPTKVPEGLETVEIANAINDVLTNPSLSDDVRTQLQKSLTGTPDEQIDAINKALLDPSLTPHHQDILGNALAAAGRLTPQPVVEDDDDFPWWLIFIVLGGLLLACCIAAGVLWKKNQKKGFPHVGEDDIETPPSPSSDGSIGMRFDDFLKLEQDMLAEQAKAESVTPVSVTPLQTPARTPPPFSGRGAVRSYQPRTPPPTSSLKPVSRLRALPEDDLSLPFSTLGGVAVGRGHNFTPRPSRRNSPTPGTPPPDANSLTFDKIEI
eukprot:TRINITY_DN1051_c5_g1_i1.p1 TRINITY_DN1051_c5_g1~~TRINITY_DN1051_c5_g1_i1.p1  ORF type:complete len:329 (+),score=74.45 TRINITY_DN1051_c5_g1_i1:69-989(+)